MTPEGEALLLQGGRELGLDLLPHTEAFARLLALLREGSARMNLTALREESDIILKHFIDSLSCLRGGYLDGEQRVVDLGTGAGFPALPLAIVQPMLQMVPVDATRKKIDYVSATAASLGLNNVQPLVGRAEALGHDPAHRERYDRVVVRAVASLPALVELSLPLLRPGGLLVAQKGPISAEELEAGRRTAGVLGGVLEDVQAFELPVLNEARTLVVFRKTRPTSGKYPRREGIPAKQPLF
ncbi:16S rRNA (guanine(527)-N(7))-methyltransferase RsmG [Deinococcus sp. KNUC1210]|uniref:16S rRNA (guanine(527)-N(7))-methyltransferase RsmG n=1 Tax=Deinococcus sp. KNUC1210 TaxID=2917691 RepID=UPI001EF030A3|nr:16S rRNA (guanine(527)-N(7))-methyltransferase RsmG [Deinococcus sp. KNUC1210]ULH14718.1 16S rRNA (guanine(527)-N(7))-methyltransferase RsmG [Deinococcus sp. KNUC1210]